MEIILRIVFTSVWVVSYGRAAFSANPAGKLIYLSKPSTKFGDLFNVELNLLGMTRIGPHAWIADEGSLEQRMVPACLRHEITTIASGLSPRDLIDSVSLISNDLVSDTWIIDYECVEPYQSSSSLSSRSSFSSKMMACAIAQKLPGTPLLSISEDGKGVTDVVTYVIVETRSKIYLGVKNEAFSERCKELDRRVSETWKKRPFLFSSALSTTIADSVVNIAVTSILESRSVTPSVLPNCKISLLDCCCGSGTVLFSGVRHSHVSSIYGSDIQQTFVEGTRRNLHFASENLGFNIGDVVLSCMDASDSWEWNRRSVATTPVSAVGNDVDCVVCNFPWNQNILAYDQDIEHILENIVRFTRAGCFCVFITKTEFDQGYLENFGFDRSGNESIKVKKGKDSRADRADFFEDSTSCVITFARVADSHPN
jgi:hypothetical protein